MEHMAQELLIVAKCVMLVVKTGCTEAGVGQVRGSPLWRRMPYSVLFSKELFLFSSCNQKARLSAFVTLSLPCSYSFLLRIDYLSQKKKKSQDDVLFFVSIHFRQAVDHSKCPCPGGWMNKLVSVHTCVCLTYDMIPAFLFHPHFFAHFCSGSIIAIDRHSHPPLTLLLSCSLSLHLLLFLRLQTLAVCRFLYPSISSNTSLFGKFLFIFQPQPSKLEFQLTLQHSVAKELLLHIIYHLTL